MLGGGKAPIGRVDDVIIKIDSLSPRSSVAVYSGNRAHQGLTWLDPHMTPPTFPFPRNEDNAQRGKGAEYAYPTRHAGGGSKGKGGRPSASEKRRVSSRQTRQLDRPIHPSRIERAVTVDPKRCVALPLERRTGRKNS